MKTNYELYAEPFIKELLKRSEINPEATLKIDYHHASKTTIYNIWSKALARWTLGPNSKYLPIHNLYYRVTKATKGSYPTVGKGSSFFLLLQVEISFEPFKKTMATLANLGNKAQEEKLENLLNDIKEKGDAQ